MNFLTNNRFILVSNMSKKYFFLMFCLESYRCNPNKCCFNELCGSLFFASILVVCLYVRCILKTHLSHGRRPCRQFFYIKWYLLSNYCMVFCVCIISLFVEELHLVYLFRVYVLVHKVRKHNLCTCFIKHSVKKWKIL